MLGAQHPSGAWCTYNTPLNGNRQPSHIQIAFQIRPGTPHLNCCSVNGPRGYGMISEWGVMRSDAGLVLNYLGKMRAEVQLADGTPVALRVDTDYPLSGSVRIVVEPAQPREFALAVRIPAWSSDTAVTVAGEPMSDVCARAVLAAVSEMDGGGRDPAAVEYELAVRGRAIWNKPGVRPCTAGRFCWRRTADLRRRRPRRSTWPSSTNRNRSRWTRWGKRPPGCSGLGWRSTCRPSTARRCG